MIFSSYEFILFFLPIVVLGFYTLGLTSNKIITMAWLIAASLFFYGWWNPIYLPLILTSVLFNFFVGTYTANPLVNDQQRKIYLIIGLVGNLSLLGYFKYANFFVDNVNGLLNTDIHLQTILLPLAISFFTFQQIAYLVDAYQSKKTETSLLRYGLFVCFFPQLIAGPIVHHKEMLPQFDKDEIYRFDSLRLSLGISVFIIGLAKKVLLADNISVYANPIFDAAAAGESINMLDAWVASFSYTFQLYFDFSGYCDMALGLGLMFGIRLPINFNSPLKAVNMIEFWRRWHITLSRFLQQYLFIPFSMNELRRGWSRQPIYSFLATMLLGGLWHGASWTFIVWGLIHGVFLVINQMWLIFKKRFGRRKSSLWGKFVGRVIVLSCWVFSLIIFRSEDLPAAWRLIKGLIDVSSIERNQIYMDTMSAFPWLLCMAIIIWLTPNTVQIFSHYCIATGTQDVDVKKTHTVFLWKPNFLWGIWLSTLFVLSLLSLNKVNEFLYFQF